MSLILANGIEAILIFSRGLDILLYFVFLSLLFMFTGTCLGLPAGGRVVSKPHHEH